MAAGFGKKAVGADTETASPTSAFGLALARLIQIDGSEHRWFEERCAPCTLLVFIDDATSRIMQLRFRSPRKHGLVLRGLGRLWSTIQGVAKEQPTPTIALAVAGMNDVLNRQGYTQAAWWNRIPTGAWCLM